MNPILYIVLVLLCSALLAGVGWLLMSDLCAFNRGPITEKTVEITADGLDEQQAVEELVALVESGFGEV